MIFVLEFSDILDISSYDVVGFPHQYRVVRANVMNKLSILYFCSVVSIMVITFQYLFSYRLSLTGRKHG